MKMDCVTRGKSCLSRKPCYNLRPMPASADFPLNRVVILGTSCSGKSTFAAALAEVQGTTHIELDALHWRPNWTPAPQEEFRSDIAEAIAAETWVLDGNYSRVRDLVWARATTLIWLNYSFPVTFGRALRRTFRRSFYREELWAGNRESWRLSFFDKESILWWVLTTYGKRRREYPPLFAQPENQHLKVVVFTAPGQAARFLRDVNSGR